MNQFIEKSHPNKTQSGTSSTVPILTPLSNQFLILSIQINLNLMMLHIKNFLMTPMSRKSPNSKFVKNLQLISTKTIKIQSKEVWKI